MSAPSPRTAFAPESTAVAVLRSGIQLEQERILAAADVRSTDPRVASRVLVVDDEPSTRHMIVNYLEARDGCGISASASYDVGRHFARGEPELVVILHVEVS